MQLLDLTFPTPEENLACDEALLHWCEEGGAEEILRFWEPNDYFIVLGYGNRISAEVNRAECQRRNIRILRRCSGGGAVLQGPGCLNYALVLQIAGTPALHSIPATNRYIMEKNRAALDALLCETPTPTAPDSSPAPLLVQGHTDLSLGGLKFSGNAQRRLKHCLLFHGTVLFGFDLDLMERTLQLPSRQPTYRRNRPHREFLINFPNMPIGVKRALQQSWEARSVLNHAPLAKIKTLALEKYATDEWNFRFP